MGGGSCDLRGREDERTTRCERRAHGIYLAGKRATLVWVCAGVQVYTAKLTFAIWVVLCRWLDCIATRLVPEPGRVALCPPLKPRYCSLRCTSAAPPPPPSHQISLFKGTTKTHAHKPQQRDFMGHYNGSSESGESADASLLPQEIKRKRREKIQKFCEPLCC